MTSWIDELLSGPPDFIADHSGTHVMFAEPVPRIDGHPVVAMSTGVATSFAKAGHIGAEQAAAFALPRLLPHATDTAGDGEPKSSLYVISAEHFAPSPYIWIEADHHYGDGMPSDLWVKQNHPHDEYILLWPDEY